MDLHVGMSGLIALPRRLVGRDVGEDRRFQHARGTQRLEAVREERPVRDREEVRPAAEVGGTAAIVGRLPGQDLHAGGGQVRLDRRAGRSAGC